MKFLCLCLLGITVFVELLLPTVANPDGFLNINCGALKDETDKFGLLWVSDSSYIEVKSRQNYTVPGSVNDIYLPFQTLSYFIDVSQKKYCYLLPVKPGIPYLVRTEFDYGRYNFLLPLANVFDILIGGIIWTQLNLTNVGLNIPVRAYEIILAPKSDRMSLCLARNSQTPSSHYVFISTIELRQLDSSMYKTQKADFDKSALIMIRRKNFGGEYIDYRHDESEQYDRHWYSYALKGDVDNLTTSDSLNKGLQNQVPQRVLQTAISAKEIGEMDISDAFVNSYGSLSPGSYYFLFYFCNINLTSTLGTNNSFIVRIIDQETKSVELDYLDCSYLDQNLDLSGTIDTDIKVVLSPSDSASRPFINGAELYKILDVQNHTHLEDVLAIKEIAEAINVPDDWLGADPCLPSNYSSTGITCSEENPPRVVIVNLTNRGLVGNIPPCIAKLTALRKLLLGNNSLSGAVPDLSLLTSLTTLQLQQNQLEGSIPTSLEKLSLLNQLYLQNNNLTGTVPRGLVKPSLDLRTDPQLKYHQINFPAHKRKSWTTEISVGCSVLLVLVVSCTAFLWRHRHRSQLYNKYCSPPKASADEEDQSEYRTLAIEYTEDDIKAASKNYSTVIGKGSFGSVFYGRISGSDVAVKVLSTDSNQGQQEFHNELTILSRIHHKNLVNLVGYCRQPVVALVYEYMPCGSLKDHLYGITKMEKPLDWHTRLYIALQAAEGLLYLHHGCNPPIIHRDIKCSNILLDGNMCAKVADFGLSKTLESSKSYVSTIVKGTLGYLDPEYYETSALTEKSDVYSFGVVLLEIISGVSPKDGIVESGRKLISCGRLVDVIDTPLDGRYNLASAWRVAEVAYGCTERNSKDRPKMSEVVKELQEAAALPEEDVNRFGSFSITESTEADLPRAR